jgi:uncharacterized protein YigA (DUF484 family)
LNTQQPGNLPNVIVDEIQHHFMVPQVAIRVWNVDQAYEIEPFTHGVSDDVKAFAAGLRAPYCGANAEFEAVNWLAHPHEHDVRDRLFRMLLRLKKLIDNLTG